MKTLIASMMTLGLFASAASAEYCPSTQRINQVGQQRPSAARTTIPVQKVKVPAPAPETLLEQTAAPIEPVPQK